MSEEDKKIYHRLMYYNDKEHLAKRIIDLQKGINYLKSQLKQKENIIKEVREYIESYGITKEQLKKMSFGSAAPISIGEMLNILEILDKEVK